MTVDRNTPRPDNADQKAQEAGQRLRFASDKGASRSTWIAALLVVAIVGWMGSGFVIPSEEEETVLPAREQAEPVSVAVSRSEAETITQFFQAEGQAQPDRDTMLVAESSGDIAQVLVRKGQDVAAGAVIARFDPDRTDADLRRAEEELARAQREFDTASALVERGVATQDRLAQARAALASAEAGVAAAQEARDALTITAPFAGRIESLDLDEGEFVAAGSAIGRLVDNTPLTVAIQVPQQSVAPLQVGQPARVSFITGEERQGVLSFIGTAAASETRTFLAEIEVANEDGSIPAGVSAEVVIPTGQVEAHFLPASILSLNTEGTLGVKTVDDENVVAFYPIEIARAQLDGIWVTGLPDQVRLITIGQGYVNAGEPVIPTEDEVLQ